MITDRLFSSVNTFPFSALKLRPMTHLMAIRCAQSFNFYLINLCNGNDISRLTLFGYSLSVFGLIILDDH